MLKTSTEIDFVQGLRILFYIVGEQTSQSFQKCIYEGNVYINVQYIQVEI